MTCFWIKTYINEISHAMLVFLLLFRVKQMYKEALIGGIISEVRVDQSLVFYVVFCRTMFVFLSIFL
jgi:uncharacterized membrane protein